MFWQSSIAGLNAHSIWFSPGTTRVAFSDASSTGYRSYVVELGSDVAHGQWSELQMAQSTTWRELKAVDLVLRFFASKLASGHNSQLQRFHSRYWDPGSEAVDTFTVSWRYETCWWVPPLHLVCRSIRHTRECGAVGTLVVPVCKSVPFWPLLCPDG